MAYSLTKVLLEFTTDKKDPDDFVKNSKEFLKSVEDVLLKSKRFSKVSASIVGAGKSESGTT